MENNDNKYKIVTDIRDIENTEECYGYWHTYLFNDSTEEYEPIYDEFIFYKGKFFDNLESKPWNDESYQKVRMLSNYFNRNNEPKCIFRRERDL